MCGVSRVSDLSKVCSWGYKSICMWSVFGRLCCVSNECCDMNEYFVCIRHENFCGISFVFFLCCVVSWICGERVEHLA